MASVPLYLQLPDPVLSVDDAIVNDGYFPDLSQAEFEKNYQVTDVFSGKTNYLLQASMIMVNHQIDKVVGSAALATELNTTYRLCVYAYAMAMICQRYGAIDTQTNTEFKREQKANLAVVYENEFRRLLFVLVGTANQMTCELI